MRPAAEPITPRRKWLAISLATLVATVAYWAFLIGFARPEGASALSAGAIALSLALLPFAFLVLAFGSGHPRAPGAVLAAMGLSIVVGAPVLALTNPVMGIVAAFASGGAVALRPEPVHTRRSRAVAAGMAVVFVGLLTVTVPPAGIALAPGFPFTAVGLADLWAENRP